MHQIGPLRHDIYGLKSLTQYSKNSVLCQSDKQTEVSFISKSLVSVCNEGPCKRCTSSQRSVISLKAYKRLLSDMFQ